MEEDVMRITTETGCKYYCYAQEKLLWFQNKISDFTIQYKQTVHLEPEQKKGSKLLEKLSCRPSGKGSITTDANGNACTTTKVVGCNQGYISSECQHYLNGLDHEYPKICSNILKTTDAGPGVCVS